MTSRAMPDHERRQHDAWAVHQALLLAETYNPGLRDNPQWRLHRMDAYETFHNLMAAGCCDGN